jgi:hypothetical protein
VGRRSDRTALLRRSLDFQRVGLGAMAGGKVTRRAEFADKKHCLLVQDWALEDCIAVLVNNAH